MQTPSARPPSVQPVRMVLSTGIWLTLLATTGLPAAAQNTSPAAGAVPALATPSATLKAPLPDGKPLPGSAANQLIERIQVDDADVRIEESRFGGETRSITVIPKGGFPAYEVRPTTGRSTWKILGF